MFKPYHRLLAGIVTIPVLVACATPPQSQISEAAASSSPGREYAKDFLDEFAKAKLRKNGEYIFCDQPGYLACFKSSRDQCLRQLSAIKEGCMKRAEQKFPNRLTTEAAVDEFAGYFAACMMIQHAALTTGQDTNALGTCLKNAKWDKAQRDKSFIQ